MIRVSTDAHVPHPWSLLPTEGSGRPRFPREARLLCTAPTQDEGWDAFPQGWSPSFLISGGFEVTAFLTSEAATTVV